MSQTTFVTPKIIHILWLDFDKKTDAVLTDTLKFFLYRIKEQHPPEKGWTINYVNKWDECLKGISSEPWLVDLINHKYVGPAHKSDALRYYYLYKMGGIWIDISTFLVSPLDDLVSKNRNGFTCYYMPSDICASWIIKTYSGIYEDITIDEYNQKLLPHQSKYIRFKNTSLNFVTENYFLISSKSNEIPKMVLAQLETFWTSEMVNIKSQQDKNYAINKLVFNLLERLFIIDESISKKFKDFLTFLPDSKRSILDVLLDGYIFNYLQLYLAIEKYSQRNHGTLKNIELSKNRRDTIELDKLSSFSNGICYNSYCNDKVIEMRDTDKNVNLLSASYNRLIKWSDTRENRLTWNNTLAGDIITDTGSTPIMVIDEFKKRDISQLKFGAYTRESPSIIELMRLFDRKFKLPNIDKKFIRLPKKSTKSRKNRTSNSSSNSTSKIPNSVRLPPLNRNRGRLSPLNKTTGRKTPLNRIRSRGKGRVSHLSRYFTSLFLMVASQR